MDTENMQVETAESTAEAPVTTGAELEIFDSEWDGDGLTGTDDFELEADEAPADAPEADQPEETDAGNALEGEETPAEEQNEQTEAQTEEVADQRLTVKHLDEIREFDFAKDKDELTVLVQKGMDYDRKTTQQSEKISEYEEFLTELCPEGLSIEQMMDLTRARLYKHAKAKEGQEISESDALLFVQKDRREKRAAAKTAAKEEADRQANEAKQKNSEAIRRFVEAYPDMKAEDIPQTVWDESKKDGDLLGAYTRYENKKLKAENEALKQNEKNKARSTGSRKTEGAASAKDPFDAAWDAF